jgi:hypothetical protein
MYCWIYNFSSRLFLPCKIMFMSGGVWPAWRTLSRGLPHWFLSFIREGVFSSSSMADVMDFRWNISPLQHDSSLVVALACDPAGSYVSNRLEKKIRNEDQHCRAPNHLFHLVGRSFSWKTFGVSTEVIGSSSPRYPHFLLGKSVPSSPPFRTTDRFAWSQLY